MSDKNTYNEDFINKGWQDMSAILDKEMPVKKKKKRFFILFFFFGLLGVIAAGIMLTPMSTNEAIGNGIIANERADNNVIDMNNPKGKIDINKEINTNIIPDEYEEGGILKEKNNTIIKENKIPKNILNTNFNNKSSAQNIGAENKLINNNTPLNKSFNNNEKVVFEYGNSLINNELGADNNLLINDELMTDIVSGEQLPIPEKTLILNFKPLDPIAINSSLLEDEKIEEIKKIPIHFNPKKWNFGIAAGLVFQNSSELGCKVGFVATRHLNRKWALHTGLEYNAHFISYTSANAATTFEFSNQSMDGAFSSIWDYEQIYVNSPTKMTSHVIKIPLLLAYRFNRSFELNAGMIHSFNVYSNERVEFLADPAIGLAIPETVVKSKTIKPFYDPQASLGLTYYPSRKWGISMRYDHGFIKKEISATISETDYQPLSRSNANITGYGSHYRLLNFSAKMYF